MVGSTGDATLWTIPVLSEAGLSEACLAHPPIVSKIWIPLFNSSPAEVNYVLRPGFIV